MRILSSVLEQPHITSTLVLALIPTEGLRLLGFVWRVEAVAGAADGGDQGRLAGMVYLLVPEVPDVDVYDVGTGVEVGAPDAGEYLLAREDLPRVAHEALQKRELAAGE